MNKLIRVLLPIVMAVVMASPVSGFHQAFAQGSAELVLEHPAGWELEKGDWIVANVAENTLQFVREDYSAISEKIRIGSGKILDDGKKMYYLGISYDPKTPEKVWEIREKVQQHWKSVFGSKEAKEQLFLRLFEVKGKERIWTHYGIHTTPLIDTFFADNGGFASWGCILARYDLLKKIEALYELNDHVVRVITTSEDTEVVMSVLN